MMKYTMQAHKRRWPRRVIILAILIVLLGGGATIVIRRTYTENLKAVSNSQTTQIVTIEEGASVEQIANLLESKKLIRSAWAFKLYVSSKEVRDALQAGTYSLEPSQSVPEIVAQLTHGKIATSLVTILPGQNLDQIRKRLLKDGFSEADVASALNARNYAGNPALVDKPSGSSLEGYLYPDSFQKNSNTTAARVVIQSLEAMQARLTPDLRSAFAKQGLSTYQAIILASIVEKEVSHSSDRTQVAQVFLKRLRTNVRLQSDATAAYGALLDGKAPSLTYESPYNTYNNAGLPPTPISNVTNSSLQAVANPAGTDWLYFVSGDDGTTYFSKTLDEHERNIQQYCRKLCGNE